MKFLTTILLAIVVTLGILTWKQSRLATVAAVVLAVLMVSGVPGDTWLLGGLAVMLLALSVPLFWFGRLVRKTRVAPMTDVYEIRDQAMHRSTPVLDEYMDAQGVQLTSAGFTRHADFVEIRRDGPTITLTFYRPFTNADTRVMLAGLVSRQANVELAQPPVAICSTLLDSHVHLLTSSVNGLDALPQLPHEDCVNLPSLRDVSALLAAHHARISRQGTMTVARPAPSDWIARVRRERQTLYEYYVERGLVAKETPTAFHLTWKGVFRFVFLASPVLRPVHEFIARRREARLLEGLGVEVPAPVVHDGVQRQSPLRFLAPFGLTLALVLLLTWFPGVFWLPGEATQASTLDVPKTVLVPDSFAGAVELLAQLSGKHPVPLRLHPDVDSLPTEFRAVLVSAADAEALVKAVHAAFLAKRFLIFHTTHHADGSGLGADAVALAPLADPYAVMRRVGTNGDNFGIATDSIIAWFRATERDVPLRFHAIGFDFIRVTMEQPVEDPRRLGARYLELCPDVAGAGVSARRAGRELARDRYIYCWWD